MPIYADINPNSNQPKYKQLVDLIIRDIKLGVYKMMDKLPSINDISAEYDVSRDTVERALKLLRKKGIIKSIERKGYFITKVTVDDKLNIAFITNRIPDLKRNIYDVFTNLIDDIAHVDVYVYNYNIKKFETIITGHINDYNYFVVIPYFESPEDDSRAKNLLEKIHEERLIILDREIKGLKLKHSSFVQDFELDIRKSLIFLKDKIIKYKKHYLIFPENTKHPKEVIRGYTVFCKMFNLEFAVLASIDRELETSSCYILLDDYDLVTLTEMVRGKNFIPGKDIGIVSYNESPLKQILLGGVTVISTDWVKMGESAAEVILNSARKNEVVPYIVLDRKTL